MPLAFRSAGESHGKGCLAVLEGLPKDLPIDLAFVDAQLARRQRGHGRSARQKLELDRVEILTGVRGGATLEAPLCLWVPNRDQSLERLANPTRPRPGHADLAGCLRHGDRDIRANIERASARETAARVAAGAVAQILLRTMGVEVLGHVVRIGPVAVHRAPGEGLADAPALLQARPQVALSEVGVLEAGLEASMRAEIDAAGAAGDTLGGVVEVVAAGLPAGWGSFAQWTQRLDGRIAQALMSIPAIKAVEIGAGTAVATSRGSAVHDAILADAAAGTRRPTNRAGGLEGGVTNGQPLVVRLSKKPIATLRRPLASVDLATGEAAQAGIERSDVCAVPAAAVVAEAMVALVLADAALELYGGSTLTAVLAAHAEHVERARRVAGGRAPA